MERARRSAAAAGPSRRVRVTHISTAHSADDSRVFWRECVGLASRGFDVTLIARAASDREDHGVRVVALPTYRRRPVRMTLGVGRAFIAAVRSRPDIVHLHDPELVPLIPWLRLMGKKVVYDAHEWLSRQVDAKPYLPPATKAAAKAATEGLEFAVSRMATRIVTVNEACAEIYPPKKVTIVANFPERARFDDFGRADREPDLASLSAPAFVYVGGVSEVRGALDMVAAIGLLNLADGDDAGPGGALGPASGRDAVDRARLRLVGPFASDALRERAAADPGWRFVDYAGVVPHDQVRGYLRGAVAGLATLLPTPNHLISSPVKVFEYMAMGLPVIISDFPAWRRMLDGVDCAVWVDPSDPGSIADAMRALLDDPQRVAAMGSAARRAVLERFNWDAQLGNLVGMYQEMLP